MTRPGKGVDFPCGYRGLRHHLTPRTPSFLWGVDDFSGSNYEHRQQRLADRIRLLYSLLCHRCLRLCADDQKIVAAREGDNINFSELSPAKSRQ